MGAELVKQLEKVEDRHLPIFTKDDSRNKTMDEQLARYDFVRFTFADINGIPRGKVVPKRHATEAMRDGIGAYGGQYYTIL